MFVKKPEILPLARSPTRISVCTPRREAKTHITKGYASQLRPSCTEDLQSEYEFSFIHETLAGTEERPLALNSQSCTCSLPDFKPPASDSEAPCEVCEKRLEVFRLCGCGGVHVSGFCCFPANQQSLGSTRVKGLRKYVVLCLVLLQR